MTKSGAGKAVKLMSPGDARHTPREGTPTRSEESHHLGPPSSASVLPRLQASWAGSNRLVLLYVIWTRLHILGCPARLFYQQPSFCFLVLWQLNVSKY